MSMDFSCALSTLKQGNRIFRKGWHGKGMWLTIMWPDRSVKYLMHEEGADKHPVSILPAIYLRTPEMEYVPWVASQTDLLADDWVVVE